MKSGYDQFFKTAQKVAADGKGPKISLRKSQMDPVPRPLPRKPQTQDAKILAHQLRESMRPRIQKKKKKSIPWKLVGVSVFGLFITVLGLYKIDDVEKLAKHIEFSLIGVASAEDVVSKAADAPKAEKDKTAAKEKEAVAAAAAAIGKKELSEEDVSHFSKLNERKRELDAREEELNRMEQELALQKTDLEKRLVELESTRRNISSVLDEKVQVDEKKVENLVQMYSNMKPQHAAKAFEDMDEGLAIEILGRMKKKNAAEIMNLVKSEKVKILSEKYTGYKRN